MPQSKQSKIRPHQKRKAQLTAPTSQRLQTGARAEKKKRAEIERLLREVSERFESGFVNAPIGMGIVDMNGTWLQVNDALCRITGYPERELKATTLEAITHPEDVGLAADDLQRLLAGEIRSYQVEKRYRHAWGHYVWMSITVSVVRDVQGDPIHIIKQVQDISERREQARQLEYLVDHDF